MTDESPRSRDAGVSSKFTGPNVSLLVSHREEEPRAVGSSRNGSALSALRSLPGHPSSVFQAGQTARRSICRLTASSEDFAMRPMMLSDGRQVRCAASMEGLECWIGGIVRPPVRCKNQTVPAETRCTLVLEKPGRRTSGEDERSCGRWALLWP